MSIKEYDLIRLMVPTSAELMGSRKAITLPQGSEGTVVLLHSRGGEVVAYEVEFVVGESESALVTFEKSQVGSVVCAL